jgi:SAM-dependent methyltransferase
MPSRKRQREEAEAPLTDDRGRSHPGYRDYRFYSEQRYWQQRHTLDRSFEWFLTGTAQLMPLLDLLLAPDRLDSRVLDLGCGTSSLLSDMRAAGYTGQLRGVDFSPRAVSCCSAAARAAGHGDAAPSFHCADAANLSSLVGDGDVDVVVDKATLHGIFSSPRGEQIAARVLSEVHRIMADGGMLLSISG